MSGGKRKNSVRFPARPSAALKERFSRLVKGRRFQQNAMMFVIMLLFGIIIMNHVVSVRAEQKKSSLPQRYKQRQEDLAKYEERYLTLLAENEMLNQKKADVIADYLASQGLENLLAELEKIRIMAGFTEVQGPGIILTLDDKPKFNNQLDSSESIVHDGDIRHAVDLLKEAGAAAFSINGLRYTNITSIYCIGPTIRCNSERLTPPYVITALGAPAALAKAIQDDQIFNIRQSPGIDLVVKVQQEDQVFIPAFAEADDIGQFIDLLEGVK